MWRNRVLDIWTTPVSCIKVEGQPQQDNKAAGSKADQGFARIAVHCWGLRQDLTHVCIIDMQIASRQPIATWWMPGFYTSSLAFLPDGRRFVCAAPDGQAHLYACGSDPTSYACGSDTKSYACGSTSTSYASDSTSTSSATSSRPTTHDECVPTLLGTFALGNRNFVTRVAVAGMHALVEETRPTCLAATTGNAIGNDTGAGNAIGNDKVAGNAIGNDKVAGNAIGNDKVAVDLDDDVEVEVEPAPQPGAPQSGASQSTLQSRTPIVMAGNLCVLSGSRTLRCVTVNQFAAAGE
jgi:hypothetical protein